MAGELAVGLLTFLLTCTTYDARMPQDAVDFFHAFFEKYPQFKSNDFYLTAESYGGIYIPTFMKVHAT